MIESEPLQYAGHGDRTSAGMAVADLDRDPAAVGQAVKDGVYNKWSRLSAVYAAKVNKDEFPIAEFTVQPDKTRDTVLSTSFIKLVRRGSTVVDYLNQTSTDTSKAEGTDDTKAPVEAPKKENK